MGKVSQFDKFLSRLVHNPIPNDITFEKMSRFLLTIKCTMRKRTGTRHRQFEYPGYPDTITLMDNERVREYQIKQVRDLLRFIEED